MSEFIRTHAARIIWSGTMGVITLCWQLVRWA